MTIGKSGTNAKKGASVAEGQAYLNQGLAKNEETKSLKKKIEEYEKLLEFNKARIETLENERRRDSVKEGQILKREDSHRGDIIKEAQSTEEAKKYAHAAQQTIQTLHEIIEDKNAQLQRKEDMLKKLREETLSDKRADITEIQRLNQVNAELMQDLANSASNGIPNRSMADSIIMGRVSAPAVEAVLAEKDQLIKRIDQELANQQLQKGELSKKLKEVIIIVFFFGWRSLTP